MEEDTACVTSPEELLTSNPLSLFEYGERVLLISIRCAELLRLIVASPPRGGPCNDSIEVESESVWSWQLLLPGAIACGSPIPRIGGDWRPAIGILDCRFCCDRRTG